MKLDRHLEEINIQLFLYINTVGRLWERLVIRTTQINVSRGNDS